MLESWLTRSSILSGSLVLPFITISVTFFRVLHWPISMSTARIITAILGLARISFLAASSLDMADSVFMAQPVASPLRTMSDAAHTSDRASRRAARGS